MALAWAELSYLLHSAMRMTPFSITFRALAGETGWAEATLQSLFLKSLSEPVKDALAPLQPPTMFDALVSTAARLDNWLIGSFIH